MSRVRHRFDVGAPQFALWAGKRLGATIAPLLVFVALLALGLWNLDGSAPWWDEGWTLSVARNVAERGFYGRLLIGQPAPPGLEAAPVITLPIAGFFDILGVGLWQGRVFGVVCAAGAVTLLWLLAARLYDRKAAWGAIGTLLLLSAHPQLNPLIQGRQVLGELPMMFVLLAGMLCLWAALRGPVLWLVPGTFFWVLALIAKAQTLPFLAASLCVAAGAALLMRRWRSAVLVVISGVAALLLRPYVMQGIWRLGPPVPAGWQEAQGMLDVTAVVPLAFNRVFALQVLLFFALPAVLALGWALWHEARALRRGVSSDAAVLRWALLGFAGSWLAWFALLSVGVPRYAFPATFVAAIFVGALLRDLCQNFDPRATLEQLAAPLRTLRRRDTPVPSRTGSSFATISGAWVAVLLVAAMLPLTVLSYARYYPRQDAAAQRIAVFLDQHAPTDALVETYEAELHFFLQRPYHYPSDQVHVQLNRRSLLGQDVPVDYEPLAADPDYLVVGQFARGNRLYAATLAGGAFELVLRDGEYEVFVRVR